MTTFKVERDERYWLVTIDGHDHGYTLWLTDDEADDLEKMLEPVRERRAEIADHKAIYKGLRQAGYFETELEARPGWDFCG